MPTINDSPGVSIIYVNTGLSGIYLKKFLDPSNTTAAQHEITRNMAILAFAAATKATKAGTHDSVIDGTHDNILLIPVLRAALPMYVVAQTTFPRADTVLVRCTKGSRQKSEHGVEVKWMGRKAFATGSDFDRKDIVLMDTVIGTGDTIMKLLDVMTSTIDASGVENVRGRRRVTIVTCFANPQALARIKMHPLVKNMVVGALADSFDGMGFVVSSTGGNLGDKLFGEMAEY